MASMFSPDSRLMETLSKVVDYILLNILSLLLCIPVITAGASMTAKYYVSMKIARGEVPTVWQHFWKSFKENFVQATVLWLLDLLVIAFVAADWILIYTSESETSPIVVFVLSILTFMVSAVIACMFPMLARFCMSNRQIIRNSITFGFLHLPRLLVMVVLAALPYVCMAWLIEIFPLLWLVITTFAVIWNSKTFVKIFTKIEENMPGYEPVQSDETDA